MDSCDVLIVGGGPAGSSCAGKLCEAGLDVAILDKSVFPRDKACGGWITPAVLSELDIDPAEYAKANVLQPILAFRVGGMGGSILEINYGRAVSYGIRRREFDHFLLKRSRARLIEGVNLTSLERDDRGWIANGRMRANFVVGAGGHFCPVARLTGSKPKQEAVVVAQEAEFELTEEQIASCGIKPDTPEIYFCSDMKGYGWCFRKQNHLNIGLGRLDPHRLSEHVFCFLRFLKSAGRVGFDVPWTHLGHAYLLWDKSERTPVGEGMLLIGDAAGSAYPLSGEGILPAIQSGLLAARTIIAAKGDYAAKELERYRVSLVRQFGRAEKHWTGSLGRYLPQTLMASLAKGFLRWHWFSKGFVLDRWFLHSQ